jgi:hypothetical protein
MRTDRRDSDIAPALRALKDTTTSSTTSHAARQSFRAVNAGLRRRSDGDRIATLSLVIATMLSAVFADAFAMS